MSPPVPFITAWSGEPRRARVVTWRPIWGVRYGDEVPGDRVDQVLWAAHHEAPGQGDPQFLVVHPQRQRAAMTDLLCQVCGQAPPPDERGPLWLIIDARGDWDDWPEGALTTHPPVCVPCAQLSRERCPEVRRTAYVAVRSAASEPAGVHGTVYAPGSTGVTMLPEKHLVTFDNPLIRWVVAGQLARSLHGCTMVDLDAETPTALGDHR